MINLCPDTDAMARMFGLMCALRAVGSARAFVRSYLAGCEEQQHEPDFRLVSRFFQQELRRAIVAYLVLLVLLEPAALRSASDLGRLVAGEFGVSHAVSSLGTLGMFQFRLRLLPPIPLLVAWRVAGFTIGASAKAVALAAIDLPEEILAIITRTLAILGILLLGFVLYPCRELRRRLSHAYEEWVLRFRWRAKPIRRR